MATYTDMQSLLDEALGEFKDCGFKLTQTGTSTLELHFKGKRIAVYTRTTRDIIPVIREGCKNYLKNTAGEG